MSLPTGINPPFIFSIYGIQFANSQWFISAENQLRTGPIALGCYGIASIFPQPFVVARYPSAVLFRVESNEHNAIFSITHVHHFAWKISHFLIFFFFFLHCISFSISFAEEFLQNFSSSFDGNLIFFYCTHATKKFLVSYFAMQFNCISKQRSRLFSKSHHHSRNILAQLFESTECDCVILFDTDKDSFT